MKEIYLPKGAKKIIERLKYFGYESYVVGGCLRDVIMGSTPKDWDICTDAKPEEILHALSVWKVIPTGLKHGTITVIPEDIPYEVTTFRQDDEYRDYRRPERVTFVFGYNHGFRKTGFYHKCDGPGRFSHPSDSRAHLS